jgi:hypothetical protein
MRIPLFAHDANPTVDHPLCYKSRSAIVRLLQEGQIVVLKDGKGRDSAAQFKPFWQSLQIPQNVENPGSGQDLTSLPILSDSSGTPAAISEQECRANAGEYKKDPSEILRSREKVASYPHIFDERATSARGRWA